MKINRLGMFLIGVIALIALTATATFAVVNPSVDSYIVSIGHLQGSCLGGVCAQWRGDVWIYNPTAGTIFVTVHFLPRDQENANPDSRQIAINPFQTHYFRDILGAGLFNLSTAVGALRFTTTGFPVVVTGRSYDANVKVSARGNVTGTAGQFLIGHSSLEESIGIGMSTDIIGLGHSADWRSNLAMIETQGKPVTLSLAAFDSNNLPVGTPLENVVLRAREPKQINNVLTALGISSGENIRVRASVVAGEGKVILSASRIDNRTGDPYTIDTTPPAVIREGVYVVAMVRRGFSYGDPYSWGAPDGTIGGVMSFTVLYEGNPPVPTMRTLNYMITVECSGKMIAMQDVLAGQILRKPLEHSFIMINASGMVLYNSEQVSESHTLYLQFDENGSGRVWGWIDVYPKSSTIPLFDFCGLLGPSKDAIHYKYQLIGGWVGPPGSDGFVWPSPTSTQNSENTSLGYRLFDPPSFR